MNCDCKKNLHFKGNIFMLKSKISCMQLLVKKGVGEDFFLQTLKIYGQLKFEKI